MTETEAQRQKEIQQAEELLFTGPQALGFVKILTEYAAFRPTLPRLFNREKFDNNMQVNDL